MNDDKSLSPSEPAPRLSKSPAAVLDRLNSIVRDSGAPLEGNLCYLHHQANISSDSPLVAEKEPLRANFLQLVRRSSRLLEIGFNAGHSAALALMENPGLRYIGVDIGINPYSRACANALSEIFGSAFSVTFGDSRVVLAGRLIDDACLPDLIHVDGGHDFATARLDLLSVAAFCRSDTLVLVDDCQGPQVSEAVMTVVANGPFEIVDDPIIAPIPEQTLLRLKRSNRPNASSERRAILVAMTDSSSQAEFDVTGPSIRRYAERVGADLVIHKAEGIGRDALFPKLTALDLVIEYDRVLVIDTDVHIVDHAPNLFELIPADRPALYLESANINRESWCAIVAGEMPKNKPMRRNFYANSSVMLLPKEFVNILAKARFR